jgi:hypothetical protein
MSIYTATDHGKAVHISRLWAGVAAAGRAADTYKKFQPSAGRSGQGANEMKTYTAQIQHHSISTSPVITIVGSLANAKRAATARFRDGFLDHTIVIREAVSYQVVSSRKIASPLWTDSEGAS